MSGRVKSEGRIVTGQNNSRGSLSQCLPCVQRNTEKQTALWNFPVIENKMAFRQLSYLVLESEQSAAVRTRLRTEAVLSFSGSVVALMFQETSGNSCF